MYEIELTSDEAFNLWSLFANQIGMKATKEAYGKYWVRRPVIGERIWSLYDEQNELVAWCGLRPDPIEPVVWHIQGIFPKFSKRGYSKDIFKWCLRKTFEEWKNAEAMFFEISKTNISYIEWQREKIREGKSTVKEVGEMPGYTIFAVERK
jgi:hypothetical protein